jgi:hypothetical protein
MSNSFIGNLGFPEREQLNRLGPGQVMGAFVSDLGAIKVEPFELGEFGNDDHVLVPCGGFLKGKIGEMGEVGKEGKFSALERCSVEHDLDHFTFFMEEFAA